MNQTPQTRTNQPESPGTIPLSGPLTIYECAEKRTLLLEIVAAPVTRMVDLSQITHCDAAGIQLLVAAGKMVRDSGKPPCFTKPTAAISQALLQAGLKPELIFDLPKGDAK